MIDTFLQESLYFGVVLTLGCYLLGMKLKTMWNKDYINPLLIAIILVITVLVVLGIDNKTYQTGAKYISYLLTPATVSLAVPLYRQWELLKKNGKAVLIAVFCGSITSMIGILGLSVLFRLSHQQYVTILPKSITTAIGIGVSQELGGIVTLTVASIVVTGIFGNLTAKLFCRLFRITNPIAVGLAVGTAAHAIGTAKALEMGEVEGAMSSLSIVVAGCITVLAAPIFAQLY